MLARQFIRPVCGLRQNVRRYATEPPSKGNSIMALYTGLAAAAGVGAYYFMYQNNGIKGANRERLGKESEAQGVPASSSEQVNVPKQTGDPMMVFKGDDQGFLSLKLESVEQLNHNTKRLRFHLPEEDSVSGLRVASALLAKYKGPEMEKAVIRPYTPVSDGDSRGFLDFVIKKYPGGPMSSHLHDMSPGQRLDFKGPIPKYPWEPNKHEHIALIAGGTGITPMYQLARAIFKNPNDKTKVTLVFGNVTEEDILLKHEWSELENEYPQRFKAFYVLDNPPHGWTQGRGYINKDLLKRVLPGPKENDIKIFVCGPPGMYKAISGGKPNPREQGELTGILKELGYSADQVYKF